MSTRFDTLLAFLVVPLMALSVTADVVPRARASSQLRPDRDRSFPDRSPDGGFGVPAGQGDRASLVRLRTDVRLLRTLEATIRRGGEAGRRGMERRGFITDDEDRILVMIHEAACTSGPRATRRTACPCPRGARGR